MLQQNTAKKFEIPKHLVYPPMPYLVSLQFGVWDRELFINEILKAYVQPNLTEQTVSEIVSTCRADYCPNTEWWLYDNTYLFLKSERKTGRTTSVFLNMHDKHGGNGQCSGKYKSYQQLSLVHTNDRAAPIISLFVFVQTQKI